VLTNLKNFLHFSIPEFVNHELWSENRFTPFFRFAKLQLKFLATSDTLYLPWINNLILPMNRGDKGLTGNYYLGLWEFSDMAFAIHLLREGDVFLDIGANLGSYSLLAAGVAKARSIAFEPVPHTYQKLKRSIEVNKLNCSIDPRQIALTSNKLAANEGHLYFSTDRDCENSFVNPEYAGEKISIPVSTLNDEAVGLSPTLLKIDVEGFELDVLQGGSSVLANKSLLAIIIEGQTNEVNKILLDAGFQDFQYLPLERSLVSREKYTSNRIWIRSDARDLVDSRLSSAPAYSVYGRSF
jgi:FkbM family methyltransferase